MTRKYRTPETRPVCVPPASTASEEETDWDEIAESSWESFPASDPPSWAGQGSPRLPRPVGTHAEGADSSRI